MNWNTHIRLWQLIVAFVIITGWSYIWLMLRELWGIRQVAREWERRRKHGG